MRLSAVETERTLKHRLFLGVVGFMSRDKAPDVMRVMTYRNDYFGRHFTGLLQPMMRGPNHFTAGERELYAAYTSRLNDCDF